MMGGFWDIGCGGGEVFFTNYFNLINICSLFLGLFDVAVEIISLCWSIL